MTWVVATVIIIVILLISIFITTGAESFLGVDKKVDFSAKQGDLLASKSFFAYLLTEDAGGRTIYEQLKNQENLNDFNGNLAIKIFDKFYSEEYPRLWVGIVPHIGPLVFIKNEYFGSDPSIIGGEYHSSLITTKSRVSERITLNENKSINLVLTYE